MNNCLNCKYEPLWHDPVGKEHPRQSGECRWDGVIPAMPKIYRIEKGIIVKYSDNSGVPSNCKTWVPNVELRGCASQQSART